MLKWFSNLLHKTPAQSQQDAGSDNASLPIKPIGIPEAERRQFVLETLSNVQASLNNTLLQFMQDKEARSLPDFEQDCMCVQSACRDTAFLMNQLVNGKDVESIRREFASCMCRHMSHLDSMENNEKQYGTEQRMRQAFQCMFTAVMQHDYFNLHAQQLHLPLTRQFEINGIAPSFHAVLYGKEIFARHNYIDW